VIEYVQFLLIQCTKISLTVIAEALEQIFKM